VNGPAPELLDRRLLFFTGKGGVGKSTMAAATALLASSIGKRVLLVEVDAKAVDGEFNIAVRDTGPGIAASDQQKIFDNACHKVSFHNIDATTSLHRFVASMINEHNGRSSPRHRIIYQMLRLGWIQPWRNVAQQILRTINQGRIIKFLSRESANRRVHTVLNIEHNRRYN